MKNKITQTTIALACAGVVMFVVFAIRSTVFAQAKDFSITAYPAVIEKEVKPNEETRLLVQFRNNTDQFVTGSVKAANYTIKDKTGTPDIIDSADLTPKYGAASWIRPEYDALTIPPNDYVAVNLYVTVPPETSTCGNYALVYFDFDPNNQPEGAAVRNSSTAVKAKVGSLINFSVQKTNCKESLQVLNFSTPKFMEYGPIPVTFDLLNGGDIHFTPKGTVTITNAFNKVAARETIKDQRVFPESAKSYNVSAGKHWMIGPYTVSLSGTYGTADKPFAYTTSVWVFPWRTALIIILLLAILSLVLHRYFNGITAREQDLEEEIKHERSEIEELKDMLKKKQE
ncbi:MAG: hypothetical protein NUV65_06060 [Candidatus Roizmanbacteria bacterium]|nr:hypothetical protein [Candidatus Roizmanbacteria bacterium]